MASLSVRTIDDDVYEQLKVRAAEHGVAMEEEARRILRRAVAAPERLGRLALSLRPPGDLGEREQFPGLKADLDKGEPCDSASPHHQRASPP